MTSSDSVGGKVYLSKVTIVIGILDVIFFSCLTVFAAFSGEALWTFLVCAAIALLGVILIVAFINCRTAYTDEGFVTTTFFGITRTYTYDQVTALKDDLHETYIYVGDRRITIDRMHVGGTEFIAFVKEKYVSLHHGQPIPEPEKLKFDLFNGRLKGATSLLIAYIIMAVLAIGMLVSSAVFIYLPRTADNTIVHQSVRFVSCNIYQDEIVMHAEDRSQYRIRWLDQSFETNDILRLYATQTPVTVYSEKVKLRENSRPFYDIKAISHRGEYVLSFDETTRLHRQEYRFFIWVAAGFCVFVALFITGSVIVGRNPQNYSKWVRRLFFNTKYGYVEINEDN